MRELRRPLNIGWGNKMAAYFPFSELLKGDHFVFHPVHWGNRQKSKTSYTLFIKTGRATYRKPDSETIYVIPNRFLHNSLVAIVAFRQAGMIEENGDEQNS